MRTKTLVNRMLTAIDGRTSLERLLAKDEADGPSYQEFLEWHKGAKSRLRSGEELAEPSKAFYDKWKKGRTERVASEKAHGKTADVAKRSNSRSR